MEIKSDLITGKRIELRMFLLQMIYLWSKNQLNFQGFLFTSPTQFEKLIVYILMTFFFLHSRNPLKGIAFERKSALGGMDTHSLKKTPSLSSKKK